MPASLAVQVSHLSIDRGGGRLPDHFSFRRHKQQLTVALRKLQETATALLMRVAAPARRQQSGRRRVGWGKGSKMRVRIDPGSGLSRVQNPTLCPGSFSRRLWYAVGTSREQRVYPWVKMEGVRSEKQRRMHRTKCPSYR